jgi:hypothetical protein
METSDSVPRLAPHEVRRKLALDAGTLLVCAYEQPDACRKFALQGAIDLQELERRAPELPREAELVFYCA